MPLACNLNATLQREDMPHAMEKKPRNERNMAKSEKKEVKPY